MRTLSNIHITFNFPPANALDNITYKEGIKEGSSQLLFGDLIGIKSLQLNKTPFKPQHLEFLLIDKNSHTFRTVEYIGNNQKAAEATVLLSSESNATFIPSLITNSSPSQALWSYNH